MKKVIVFLFFCLCFALIAENTNKPFATQLISFITDDAEPVSGDIGKPGTPEIALMQRTLYLHLLEQKSIIIVSSSVLHGLMNFLKVDNNPVQLLPVPTINPANYITQQINDYIFVIIPKNYITSRPNYEKLKKQIAQKNKTGYSLEELTIGIKLNKCEIPNEQFFNPTYYKSSKQYPKRTLPKSPIIWTEIKNGKKIEHKSERTRPAPWISKKLIDSLNDIFIPKKTYHQLGLSGYEPVLTIITDGHGAQYTPIDREIRGLKKEFGARANNEINKLLELKKQGYVALLGGKIAGLESSDFAQLVKYLAQQLNVALLFFNTCFGSKVNIEAALSALEKKEKKTLKNIHFPYIIISGAISNSVVYDNTLADEIYDDNDVHKKTVLIRPNFQKFIDVLNQGKKPSDDIFVEAIQHIYTLYGDSSGYNNIPMIKYPHESWRPLSMPDKVLIIDNLFVSAHQNKTTVSLSNLFALQEKPHSRVVLFAVPHVPFTLVISGTDPILLPYFISYEPIGDAIHTIHKLSAPTYTLSDIIHHFFSIEKLRDNKVFLIDHLIALNDLTPLGNTKKPITLNKVMLMHKGPAHYKERSRFIVKFNYKNQDWQAIITHRPLAEALQKDTTGTLQQEWDDIYKMIPKNAIQKGF